MMVAAEYRIKKNKKVRYENAPCSVKPERPCRSVIVFYKTRLPKVQWDTVQTDPDKYV